jgi:translocation and assembly module TamB
VRRLLKILGIALAVLIGVVVLVVAVVLIGGNTKPGRDLIASKVGALTGGSVTVSGLSGRFPDRLRIAHLELHDTKGVYASADTVALDWSPLRLFSGEFAAERLAAERVDVARTPVSAESPSSKPSSGSSLPVTVSVKQVEVARLDIAPALAGKPLALGLAGSLTYASLDNCDIDLTLRDLGGTAQIRANQQAQGAQYRVNAQVDGARIRAKISAREPGSRLISGLAGLPNLGPITLDADLDGPRDAVATHLTLSAGPLHAAAEGSVDLTHKAADLTVNASAPAMAPRPGLSWQSVKLDATVHGPFAKPEANGTLRIAALEAGGAAIRSLAADLQGNAGEVHLKATLDGVRVPGPKPDLLEAAPLVLTADMRLDAAGRPVNFTLSHPLIAATGDAHTAAPIQANVKLHLPDLAPFAAAGGLDLQGHTDLTIDAAQQADGATKADLAGTLGITGGTAPAPGLIGDDARIAVSGTLHGSDVVLSRVELDGKTITLSASGGLAQGKVDLDWKLALSELAVLAPTVAGTMNAQGHVAGPTDDLAARIDLAGDVSVRGMPRGPIKAHLEAEHLPGAPSGRITAEGTLAGAPLALAAAAERSADGTLHLDISKADWKSAHAEAALTLAQGASFPLGKLDLRMTRLDDLRPFFGQPLSGGITASLTTEEHAGTQQAVLKAEAKDAGIPGTASVSRATLDATVADPTGNPVVDGKLAVDGFAAKGTTGSARLTVSGPQTALATRLSATMQNLAGADAKIDAATTVNATAHEANVASLEATWKGQTARLLAPVKIGFGGGVTVDRLRLGIERATVELAGRLSPTLDLTLAVRNVTPDLVKPFAPSVDADGTLQADAKLTGTPARPSGTIRVEATGLKMRTGPGRSLPAANLTATANLAGETARLDARLSAGRLTTLTVTGTAPIDPARPMDLRAAGTVDLALLDPILAPNGRRVRGRLALDANVAGTMKAPRLSGTTRLTGGELHDLGQGVHITDITAEIALDGDQVRIARFVGHAGPGTISVSGTVGVLTPDKTVDVTVTARNARPIASDRLSADLDANLTVRGALAGGLALGGTVHVRRADITIPDKFPPSIAVLNVRRPGEKPPPPPAPGPEIALDLTVSAEHIFVRGRGIFAELEGSLKLRGTSTKPQPLGAFTMRRGNFSMAGQTLTFTKGEVSFNGGSLTDPSLNFVASSTNGSFTAMLTISGTASAPKITLSSVPEAPQDEVLAQLLFKRSASSLSPFELASIASALASLTGAGPDIGNPLESVRKDLGLDRLSVGSGPGGSASLQAGRYVAPGVFVGAKQGTSGASTQGLVQIDLYKGLKLQGTVGTGANTNPGATAADSGGSSIGLTYQFDY